MSRLRAKYKNFLTVAEEHGFISPLVHVGQFKEDCRSLLPESVMDFYKKKELTTKILSEEMEVEEDTVKELEEVCSPSSLKCPREGEILYWDEPASIPKDMGLVTIDHWRKILIDSRSKNSTPFRHLLRSKYTEMDAALQARVGEMAPADESDVVSCPEIVITVCVSFPRDLRRFKACGVDYLVLGSQKLTELRDKIPCTLKEQPVGHFTDNPDNPTDIKLKDICTSAFFFIENTFFNDLRAPTSVDLSKGIMEWARNNETAVPETSQIANMEECTFNDLHIRLGCPYIFLHQGDCEHVLFFKDIRLFNSGDCQARSKYPITISRSNSKGNPCQICNLNLSTWVTRSDELAPGDPSFFCNRCFRTMHYDKQGNKIGNFTAYPRLNIMELDY